MNSTPTQILDLLNSDKAKRIEQLLQEWGMRLLFAIIILVVGSWLAKLIKRIVISVMSRREVDPTISGFIIDFSYITLLAFVGVAVLGQLGVQTASFVAVIGAGALAIGLALQGALSNFAAGFLLVVFRPFKKGDYIEGGGSSGTVEQIHVFTTILCTPDNRRVIVPNAKLMNDIITNYSANPIRRLDLTFGVSYSDNIPKVKSVLQKIAEQDARVLQEPATAQIMVAELADSSVNVTMRVWLKNEDVWSFKFDTLEKAKMTFDKESISIPFPQRDVHLFQAK